MKDFSELERQLGLNFLDKNLFIQAFCHRSYLNEYPNFHLAHNERLEFLGDAVLELVITEYLYKKYPQKNEGELTNWRAALVNSRLLGELAREMDFDRFLLLSKGEEKEVGRGRLYILANAFEALIGAIYLDQGYNKAREFVEKNLIDKKLKEIVEKGIFKDPKTKFQEAAQEKLKITPIYRVLKEWGPDHNKRFRVGVFLKDELIATGEGNSKQEAEEMAAKVALEIKGW